MSVIYQGHNEDRLRRAKSWLEQAQMEGRSDVEAFLFCWIAFNAAYGRIPEYGQVPKEEKVKVKEWELFNEFVRRITKHDKKGIVKAALDTDYPAVRRLMKNKYIFEPFWKHLRGEEVDWKKQFDERNKKLRERLKRRNTAGILNEILSRLYTLRNQITHGGVTFNGGLGEKQLRDGSRMMLALVPPILEVMEKTIERQPATEIWGVVAYPRFEEHASRFGDMKQDKNN
ncbi:MAG: hypothetical protein ACPGGG_06815 [Parvibaculales bacterium]